MAVDLDDSDRQVLQSLVEKFCDYFGYNLAEVLAQKFCKVIPRSKRPYGKLYAG